MNPQKAMLLYKLAVAASVQLNRELLNYIENIGKVIDSELRTPTGEPVPKEHTVEAVHASFVEYFERLLEDVQMIDESVLEELEKTQKKSDDYTH